MFNGEKLQKIDGGKFVCRDGFEGRNSQEEEGKKYGFFYIVSSYYTNIKNILNEEFGKIPRFIKMQCINKVPIKSKGKIKISYNAQLKKKILKVSI